MLWGARGAQWVRSLDLTAHTSLSPMQRGFAPISLNYKKDAFDSQLQVIKFTSIGDRLVWAVRSNDLTHWATRAFTLFEVCLVRINEQALRTPCLKSWIYFPIAHPWYSWNIVESGVKHQTFKFKFKFKQCVLNACSFIRTRTTSCIGFSKNTWPD
jgi:hypothetical protein